MCFIVHFSTTAPEVVPLDGDKFFRLEPLAPDASGDCIESLRYPNRWYLGSKQGGCSCHFRHAFEGWPRFSEVEELPVEDAEDVESTIAFYEMVTTLIKQGHRLDIVSCWSGEDYDPEELEVSISVVPANKFRFEEGYRYDMVP